MNAEDSYEGEAFHSDSGAPVPGTLVPLQWTLRFKAADWEVELPFQELDLEIQEKEGTVLFRHPKFPDWHFATTDFSILEHRALTQRTQLRNQIQAYAQRHIWRNALVVTLACLLVFAVVWLVASWASGQMVRVVASRIPAASEKKYGDQLFAEMKEEYKLSTNTELLAQLKQATEPLLPVVKQAFELHLVEDPTPNAAAWPGGHVMVHTGLLKLTDTPEQLAGVLAHEMAHVTQKHHFRQSISGKGPYLITRLFFNRHGFLSLLAVGSHILLHQTFSREYEREADDVGWQYLVAANINPRGAIDILRKIKAEEEMTGMVRLTQSGFSSHPPTEERIQRLESKWKRLKRQSGFMEFKTPGDFNTEGTTNGEPKDSLKR